MPMIRHDNESTEINTVMFYRETKRGDYNRACFWIENGSLWVE